MTATAETGITDPVTLAREIRAALLREIAAMLEATAEYGADAIAGGKPPKPVAYEMIAALQEIARDARGETATP